MTPFLNTEVFLQNIYEESYLETLAIKLSRNYTAVSKRFINLCNCTTKFKNKKIITNYRRFYSFRHKHFFEQLTFRRGKRMKKNLTQHSQGSKNRNSQYRLRHPPPPPPLAGASCFPFISFHTRIRYTIPFCRFSRRRVTIVRARACVCVCVYRFTQSGGPVVKPLAHKRTCIQHTLLIL